MKNVLIIVLLLLIVVTIILLVSLVIIIHNDTPVFLQESPIEEYRVNNQNDVNKTQILSTKSQNQSQNKSSLLDEVSNSKNDIQRVSDSSTRTRSSSKSTQRRSQTTYQSPQEEYVSPKVNDKPEFSLFALHIHDTHGTDWFVNITTATTIVVDKSGRWSQIVKPQLTENSVVFIPKNITIEYDSYDEQAFNALAIQGELIFDPTKDTKMSVETIAVYDHGCIKDVVIDVLCRTNCFI